MSSEPTRGWNTFSAALDKERSDAKIPPNRLFMDMRPIDETIVRNIANRVQWRFVDIYQRDNGGTRIKPTTDPEWIRKHGTDQADLAKLSYDELPDDWKYERRSGAGIAALAVTQAIMKGVPFDDTFVEYAADIVHEEWLHRNLERSKPEHRLPYSELTEEAKEKDRIFIKAAIETLQGPQGCVFLNPITWSEIFDTWREREARQASWKEHWESRGFESWDEWRRAYIGPYRPETRDWSLYRVPDPTRVFPDIFSVPTDAWIRKAYGGETTKQFRDIVDMPVFKENAKIDAIRKDFPDDTMLIGLWFRGDIVLLEGMHRAAALATRDPNIPFTGEVTIALAKWTEPELLRIGGDYKDK